MCHEWWFRRMQEEREGSRELWDEFEESRMVSDPERADEEAEIEHPDPEPVATKG